MPVSYLYSIFCAEELAEVVASDVDALNSMIPVNRISFNI